MSKKKKNITYIGGISPLELTNLTFNDYYNRLSLLAINMFKWINLPDTIDERFLEYTLYNFGMCLFFKDYDLDSYFVQQTTASAPFNIYNIPTKRKTYSANGYSVRRNINDSVIIYNNYLRCPTANTIRLFAQRLTQAERTRDINLENSKTPYIIQCNEENVLTLTNLYQRMSGNEPMILIKKELGDNITVYPLNVPFLGDELTNIKNAIWNEALTFLGIGNPSTDKKERLVTNEVSSNMEVTEMFRYTQLSSRKQACKLINEMFNLNIDVEFRNEDMNITDKDMTLEMELKEKELKEKGDGSNE